MKLSRLQTFFNIYFSEKGSYLYGSNTISSRIEFINREDVGEKTKAVTEK